MWCMECGSSAVSERSERTVQYPSDVIALVVLWRLRYKLSLRDLTEMFLIRGIVFSYDRAAKQIDGRDWEAKLTPALAEALRRRQRGKVGQSAGTSTRSTSKSEATGAISIAPHTAACAGSRAARPLPGFVEATTNS